MVLDRFGNRNLDSAERKPQNGKIEIETERVYERDDENNN